MAKDLEYYLARARRIAKHREAGAEQEIRELYQTMLKDLQQFISDVYVRYARNDRLTFAELQAAGYDARFLEEIEQRLNLSAPRASRALRLLVEQTYSAAWSGMIEGVTNASSELGTAFADSVAITPEQIRRAVENPVYGLTLKDTLEKNRRDIIYSIKQTIGVGLMNGDRYTTMARRIAKQVDGDYKKAIRIARTEAHRTREGGNRDAAIAVDTELRHGTSGLRMVKTWRTMKDERVRPQRRRKGKKGWSTRMGSGPNHMLLDGQTVLADQPFDLGGGVTADAPGLSGVAGHDINCRCYVSYEMMTDAEYYARTGKHFPGWRESISDPPVQIGGVDVTVTSNNAYAFPDGGGGTKRIGGVNVYTTPDGTQFVFPKKYNKQHQRMTPNDAIAAWQQVPLSIRVKAQKVIEFVDYYNPRDAYWRTVYKNFGHSYATGGQKITFYRWDKAHDMDYVVRTYCHEAGHFIDLNRSTSATRFSSGGLWTKARSDDRIISGKFSCTTYGENSAAEDFAESVAEYVRDKTAFTKQFPNRAAILASIL